MPEQHNHALIFGASGISGWALLKESMNYPSATTFSRITGTTNRPLTLEQACLPSAEAGGRVQLVSGIDLTQGAAAVQQALVEKVADIATVTHVFFTAYIEKSNYTELRRVNAGLVRAAVTAIDVLAPGLRVFILQTGGKAYGVEFTDKVTLDVPLKESAPRVPSPEGNNIFYYAQCDAVADVAKVRPWTWAEVRPDVIVGYAPGTNAMNAAKGVALWILLHRARNGPGTPVPFPGSPASWNNKHTDTSQDVLARFELHLALGDPELGEGRAYNIADSATVVTWAQKWPPLCAYWGMQSQGPSSSAGKAGGSVDVDAFVAENAHLWDKEVAAAGGKLDRNAAKDYSWGFLKGVTVAFDFDRQYDLSAARRTGFQEELDCVKGFETAFKRMQTAAILPPK